jgi:RHS repeat-associated protein
VTILDLADIELTLDGVGNPREILDHAKAGWPLSAVPPDRKLDYDALYRLREIEYEGLTPGSHVSPFAPEAQAGDAGPIPLQATADRVVRQTFIYDWRGNTIQTIDNANLTYDRSLGKLIVNGEGDVGPNQLRMADGVDARYDPAGNLVDLRIARRGQCPIGSQSFCAQRVIYDWDEVGRLARARRWDYPGNAIPPNGSQPTVPATAPVWDIRYAYSLGERVLKSVSASNGETRHTVDVFPSLRLQGVAYNQATASYGTDPNRIVVRLAGFARAVNAPGLPSPSGRTEHVFMSFRDSLGSTAVVLDRDSGEVVERVTYLPFGAVESDFRPTRWSAHREDFKFTGKEEDVEVGLVYFGARYYHPRLGRWASADALSVHSGIGDPNPYAYVSGRLFAAVDPNGLQDEDPPVQPSREDIDRTDDDWCSKGCEGLIGHMIRTWPETPPPKPTATEDVPFDPWAQESLFRRILFGSNNVITNALTNDRNWQYVQIAAGLAVVASTTYLTAGALGAVEDAAWMYLSRYAPTLAYQLGVTSAALAGGSVAAREVSQELEEARWLGVKAPQGSTFFFNAEYKLPKGTTPETYTQVVNDTARAIDPSAVTINMTAGGAYGNSLGPALGRPFWGPLSVDFAREAALSGKPAKVILGGPPDPSSVWNQLERPALQSFNVPIETHLRVYGQYGQP